MKDLLLISISNAGSIYYLHKSMSIFVIFYFEIGLISAKAAPQRTPPKYMSAVQKALIP